ncbi:MAG: hypothetical protein ACTSRX_04595 [Promethearchaeota archaeon]
MAVNFWIVSISLIILLVGCPLLGRLLYGMKDKQAFAFYGAISLVIIILLFFLTMHKSLDLVFSEWGTYFSHIVDPMGIVLITIIVYITAGIGLIGGTLEFIGESTETAETYKHFKKFTRVKLFFFYFIYGYIFIFAVFSFSQFLIIFLQWEYKISWDFLYDTLNFMQLNSLILPVLGSILFGVKIFYSGFFSLEFYKSEFDPSMIKVGPKFKFFRHMISWFFGTLGVFIGILTFFLEHYENTVDLNLNLGKSFFFLAASIQAFLFYMFKDRYVDQLKPLKKQFELKPGKGITTLLDEDTKSMEDYDSELKYDD